MSQHKQNRFALDSKTWAAAALCIGLASITTPLIAADWQGNVGGFLGRQSLDNSDWANHDKMKSIGMIADFKTPSAPLSFAIDLIGSGDEDKFGALEQNAYSAQIHLGVRKVFEINDSAFKPYIGGGLALIHSELEQKDLVTSSSRKQDDSANGGWFGVGTYVELSEHFQLGLDLRYSEADVTLFGKTRQAGGTQTAFTAGYHW